MPIATANSIIDRIAHSTTAICGLSKGCGKTTAFSWACGTARQAGPVALMTIGTHQQGKLQSSNAMRFPMGPDNSRQNSLVPELQVCPGDVVLTTLPQAHLSPASLEILATIPGRTSLGRLILGRAHRYGTVALMGPEHLSALQLACDMIREEGWAQSIIIDGAANRLTQLSALDGLQFIYTLRVGPDNIGFAVEQLEFLDSLAHLPPAEPDQAEDGETQLGNPATSVTGSHIATSVNGGPIATSVSLRGPLTTTQLDTLPLRLERLVIDDLSKVFLTPQQWYKLMAQTTVQVRQQIPLLCALVVLHDMSEREFIDHLHKELRMQILFNPLCQQG